MKKKGRCLDTVVGGGLLLILVFGGCGDPYPRTLYPDPVLFNSYEPRIVHGKTSEEEIRRWFGPPWSVTKEFLGNRERFVYIFRDESLRMDVLLQNGVVIDHSFTNRGAGRE